MAIQKSVGNCSHSVAQCNEIMGIRASVGQQLALLEKDLARLDGFAKAVKHRMQDRMKFMSVKTALRHDMALTALTKEQVAIRKKIHTLQNA